MTANDRNVSAREAGGTAVEYALVASLIAVVIVAAVMAVGTELIIWFDNAAAGLVTP